MVLMQICYTSWREVVGSNAHWTVMIRLTLEESKRMHLDRPVFELLRLLLLCKARRA